MGHLEYAAYGNVIEFLKNVDMPEYVKGEDLSGRKIIIGYDSRLNANQVAEWAAQVCLQNGFSIEIANRDTPTPALVYWLTDYHSVDEVAGLINMTASHNPPEWQGIKFNPRQGWPAPTNVTDIIASRINEINILDRAIEGADTKEAIKNGKMIGFDPITQYTKWILESGKNDQRISINPDQMRSFFSGKQIVIDEMHGASRGYLSKILGAIGLQHTIIHAERDPLIPGLAYANPEEPFIEGLKKEVKESGAWLGVGMDTDADRFGIVDQKGVYFRPNQILPILVRYLGLERGYKGRVIATQTGSPLLEVLAGMIEDNEEYKPEVTDKDGIWANLLVMDMLAYYGSRLRNPLTSIAEIWEDTTKIDGLWKSYGGREDPEHPENHSNSGRTDIDAILEVKEELINYFLDAYGPNKANKLEGLDVIYAGGVRYDLAELQLSDAQGDNHHLLRVRASGTEPINRVYVESSDINIAKALTKAVLNQLESITIDHLNNAPSEWILAETLAFLDVSPAFMKAVENRLASHRDWSASDLANKLQAMADSGILEKRNAERARAWFHAVSQQKINVM